MAVGAAALMALTGCRTGIRVNVDANDRGGGRVVAVVSLDRDAQNFVGNLKGQLRVADLTKAGWEVTGPEPGRGGEVHVSAVKAFTSPAGATAALGELAPGTGLFKDVRLSQTRSFVRSTTRFAGTVDLRKGIAAFGDETLRTQLGSSLGATPEEFEKRIGSSLVDALTVTVAVRLAGTVKSNAPHASGGVASWSPKLGQRLDLSATAQAWNLKAIGLGAVSGTATLATLVLGFGRRRPRRSRRSLPDLEG